MVSEDLMCEYHAVPELTPGLASRDSRAAQRFAEIADELHQLGLGFALYDEAV